MHGRIPGGMARNDECCLSGPDRLKAERRISQAEGSGGRCSQTEDLVRWTSHAEDSAGIIGSVRGNGLGIL